MNELEVELIAIEELKFDEENARAHVKGIPELAKSLQEFGQRKPVVVWGDNVVVAGNGLLEAAISLGWELIAIARVPKDWSHDKAKAFALADNRTAELSEWKLPEVSKQLFDLKALGFDMPALGFFKFNEPKTISFDVSPQLNESGYAIIIECDDEAQQADLLKRFEKQKLRARALMT
jgi:ParB-like chromosome segregation protein Spo0J